VYFFCKLSHKAATIFSILLAGLNIRMTIRASKKEDFPQIFDIDSNSKLDELQFEEQKFSLVPIEEDSKRLS
jgi:hypothetical protein